MGRLDVPSHTPGELAPGGGGGDAAGFIARHLAPVLYPATLTRDMQVVLGALVLLVNVCVYRRVIVRQGGAISVR